MTQIDSNEDEFDYVFSIYRNGVHIKSGKKDVFVDDAHVSAVCIASGRSGCVSASTSDPQEMAANLYGLYYTWSAYFGEEELGERLKQGGVTEQQDHAFGKIHAHVGYFEMKRFNFSHADEFYYGS